MFHAGLIGEYGETICIFFLKTSCSLFVSYDHGIAYSSIYFVPEPTLPSRHEV